MSGYTVTANINSRIKNSAFYDFDIISSFCKVIHIITCCASNYHSLDTTRITPLHYWIQIKISNIAILYKNDDLLQIN